MAIGNYSQNFITDTNVLQVMPYRKSQAEQCDEVNPSVPVGKKVFRDLDNGRQVI